jgi:hypothetical protein
MHIKTFQRLIKSGISVRLNSRCLLSAPNTNLGETFNMPEIIKNIPHALIILGAFYLFSAVIDKLLKKASTHYHIHASEIFRLLSNSQKALWLTVGSIIDRRRHMSGTEFTFSQQQVNPEKQ